MKCQLIDTYGIKLDFKISRLALVYLTETLPIKYGNILKDYYNMQHTLNPQQIIEAIEGGKIEYARLDGHALTFEQSVKEDRNFVFTIGEESYYCIDGKIHVNYDFELSEKHVLLLRKKALECFRENQLKLLNTVEESLAHIKSEI